MEVNGVAWLEGAVTLAVRRPRARAGLWGDWLFTERLGLYRALDFMYTGDLMTGAEAVAGGLFSRAAPAAELLAFTRSKAARAAGGPLQALVAFEAARRADPR